MCSTVTCWLVDHFPLRQWSAIRGRVTAAELHQTRRIFLVPLVPLPPLHGLGTLWAARRDNPVYGSRITVCLTGCCCMFISHFLGSLTTPGTPPGPLCFLCCQRWHKTQIRAWMGPCSAQGCGWFCDQGNLNIYLRAKLNNLLFSNRRRRREVGTEPMMIFL